MNAQVELAQTVQRDKVHPLDQLAQFLAQDLASVALDRQVQVLRQPAVGLGDPRVEPHRLRRDRVWRRIARLAITMQDIEQARLAFATFAGLNPSWAATERDDPLYQGL